MVSKRVETVLRKNEKIKIYCIYYLIHVTLRICQTKQKQLREIIKISLVFTFAMFCSPREPGCVLSNACVRAAHASHHRHLCHMIRVSKEAWYRSISISPSPPPITIRLRISPIIVRDDIDGSIQRWLATFHFSIHSSFFCLLLSFFPS
jgi:hypothetical protein